MHAKTDSEVTSLAASSPTRSPPRRPIYYVQSPSRDSHDGEKTATTASFHSTPLLSPVASPHHSSSNHRKDHNNNKPWKQIDVIEEEGLLHREDRSNTLPRRCYFLAFVLGFLVLFTVFSLILWGASRPMKPKISIKSIKVDFRQGVLVPSFDFDLYFEVFRMKSELGLDQFCIFIWILRSMKFDHVRVQAGSDSTGVATDMITMNSTLKFTYRNTGTFFGVHVAATPLDLSYSEIVIASGNMKEFYQSRKSRRLVSVAVMGNKIPLYGSGASLSSTTGVPTVPVPLKLSFVLKSRAYVLGKLVKPKYYKRIECSITLDPNKLSAPVPLKNSCTYD